MERAEFQMGVNMLSQVGMPKVEKSQLEIWFRLMQNLSNGEFESAVMHVCKTQLNFYPGTNVVGLIMETVEMQRKENRATALQEKNEAKKKEDEKNMRLIEAEYKQDPEKFVSSRKVQQLASRIGREM